MVTAISELLLLLLDVVVVVETEGTVTILPCGVIMVGWGQVRKKVKGERIEGSCAYLVQRGKKKMKGERICV